MVVFRYRDAMLPGALARYLHDCVGAGSPEHHIDLIEGTIADVQRWQHEHADRVVTPTSNVLLGPTGG